MKKRLLAPTAPTAALDQSPPDPLVLSRVISRAEATKLAGVSPATWDRIEKAGRGPRRTLISERRVGYRLKDVLAWLDARSTDTRAA